MPGLCTARTSLVEPRHRFRSLVKSLTGRENRSELGYNQQLTYTLNDPFTKRNETDIRLLRISMIKIGTRRKFARIFPLFRESIPVITGTWRFVTSVTVTRWYRCIYYAFPMGPHSRLSRPPRERDAREPLFVKDRGMQMTNSAGSIFIFDSASSSFEQSGLGVAGAVNLGRVAPFFGAALRFVCSCINCATTD